jgi:hypothetical protein
MYISVACETREILMFALTLTPMILVTVGGMRPVSLGLGLKRNNIGLEIRAKD